jgi:hypothetical protein
VSGPADPPGDRPNLDVDDYGPGVKLLQRLLGVQQTGFFEDATRRAVVAFQKVPANDLLPATGGVGPRTWAKLDELRGTATPKLASALVGALKVGDVTVLDHGTFNLVSAGFGLDAADDLLAQGQNLATGVVMIGGTPVAGGAAVKAIRVSTEAAKDVMRIGPEIWKLTYEARQGAQVATQAVVAVQRTGAAVGLGAKLGVVGLVLLAEVAIVLIAEAVIASLAKPVKVELPQGGIEDEPPTDAGAPPQQAPGIPAPAPAVDPNAPPPALTPVQSGTPVAAPGAPGGGAAIAPGTSSQPVRLGGLRIPLSDKRADRLGKAEKADKWTDLPGTDRTSLGKAYNTIVDTIVREIVSGGRAVALHYVEVTPELIAHYAKLGDALVITEGRLPSGIRFDIAMIDFRNQRVELIDLTALKSGTHAGKTQDYAKALKSLTGLPVESFEAHYVGDDEKPADELVLEQIPSE